MNTVRTWRTTSINSDDTLRLAERVGHRLRGGEAIELTSDLGGGKTTFVRGLAKGMGSQDAVHSPSFTLSNEYRAKNRTLYHFDFYRLSEPGIMRNELAEILTSPKAVVAVEWATVIKDVLPDERLRISIKSTGDSGRELTFTCPETLNYLIPENT